jgi:hypothetical protein
MPRMHGLEYANAIYHITAQGDGRRRLFHDAGHSDRFTQGLTDEVRRSSWSVKEGLTGLTDPQVQRFKDCFYGVEALLKRLLAIQSGEESEIKARRVRRTKVLSAQSIIGIVVAYYSVNASGYREFRSVAGGRDLASREQKVA